jgi:hypothetical protein
MRHSFRGGAHIEWDSLHNRPSQRGPNLFMCAQSSPNLAININELWVCSAPDARQEGAEGHPQTADPVSLKSIDSHSVYPSKLEACCDSGCGRKVVISRPQLLDSIARCTLAEGRPVCRDLWFASGSCFGETRKR